MNGTPRTHVLVLALACLAPATMVGAMAASAQAQAPAGGVAIPPGTMAQMANPTDAMIGDTVTFTGTLPPAAGHTVVVQRENRAGLWVQTATAAADANGAFTAQWQADHAGQFPLRALAATEATATALTPDPATSPVATLAAPAVTIFRPAIATWYGPGFFGRRMACGHKLRTNTLGVANRTLPCGTEVALDFAGRTITVPVVDRGPYANHANWDLTQATARALSMSETETIGVVSIPSTATATPASRHGATKPAPTSTSAAPASVAR
jgi:rare lipoprotein A